MSINTSNSTAKWASHAACFLAGVARFVVTNEPTNIYHSSPLFSPAARAASRLLLESSAASARASMALTTGAVPTVSSARILPVSTLGLLLSFPSARGTGC